MSSHRSNRSSVSSGVSSASSTPSSRSGYLHDEDPQGRRPSDETVRYQRLGTLTAIKPLKPNYIYLRLERYPRGGLEFGEDALEKDAKPKIGRVYYYTNDVDGFVSKATMKSRSSALARDRARKAAKSSLKKDKMNTGTEGVKFEYFGYVIERNKQDIFGRSATLMTSAEEKWCGNLVARQDARCFGCIDQLIGGFEPTVGVTTPTGPAHLEAKQFQNASKLRDGCRYGWLVYESSTEGQYIARCGK